MNKGYICIVQNTPDVDYLRLAYALALSIKNTQSGVNKLSIVTDIEYIPNHYIKAFDQIIIMDNDRAKDADWKLHNIVDLYDYTPYDETVMLDSDMLFLTDISHWWDYMSLRNTWFTSTIKNYKSEIVPPHTIYREEFIKNKLPNVYNAFFYFKKHEDNKELFDTMKDICENWDDYVKKHLYKKRPKVFSTDVAFGLSLKLIGMKNDAIFNEVSFPYFTHMKLQNMNWVLPSKSFDGDWTRCVDISFDEFNDSLGIKIGTLRQTGIFHYHVKKFLKDGMIDILENNYE